jgi:hypothetical protein
MSNELSEKVIGLTAEYNLKLSNAGITTMDELIKRASTREVE